MTRSQFVRLSAVVMLMLFAAAVSLTRAADVEPGFESLFDGKDLSGWEGDEKLWKVQDGKIVGDSAGINHNEFLCTKKTFTNFELRIEFKIDKGVGNSGVQFRTKRLPNSTEVSGYQADLGENYWGCLYDESRRNKILAPASPKLADALKKDDWNTYVIRADGDHITLKINDVTTVDYTEKDPDIAKTGIIALQVHAGGPMRAEFRNLRIKQLP
ncbi:MAG TPA: DUF1080 domain-containing protein [Planctomycetaceae bacterium]|nr:DUF1080 domain-containing protein [Planctomycetaceae bacterium]